ncbi:MAG: S1C family serine protease [Candidatus Bathycorpusculaceae bacterium]
MEWQYAITIDKKFILALFLVALALGGGFALVYLDIKTDLDALKSDYANVASQLEQLQDLIEQLHYTQTLNLTAVQIYNSTRNSVVLVTAGSKSGSGFVYYAGSKGEGYTVTNHHVVDSADKITVTFFIDGKPIPVSATVKGKDIYSDLAVLEVNGLPDKAKPLSVGKSELLLVGEPVYAIGNPFGLEGSMTAGIVSQTGRVLRLGDLGVPDPWGSYAIVDVIQFDAAINPGNSGGPLLNNLGEVVGVTFAIETAEEIAAFIGIGYAIPSIIMKRVVNSIIENGSYAHPWMGIAYNSSYVGGLYIYEVNASGPAEKAGLKPGDIIIKVDNRTVNRAEDLIIYLERYKSPGETIHLVVRRDNETFEVDLTLEKRPE